jgi:protoporphyrinogen oxidase
MPGLEPYDFVVLGGGLAGLTFAHEAARRGRRVAVLESGEQAGGLARTLAFDGYRFDLGGHRLHSRSPHTIEWIHDLMGGDLLQVSRRSHIFLNNRYVQYPLQLPNALLAFHPLKAAHILVSYLNAARRHAANTSTDLSFEDWVVNRFGRVLYEIYFRPYTEKVWGVRCRELASDFARQRIRLPGLAAAIKGSLWRSAAPPGSLISRFYYPPLGFGSITDRLLEQTRATGRGDVRLNATVSGLTPPAADGAWAVRFGGAGREDTLWGRQVVSTIPVDGLLALLPASAAGEPASVLSYRSIICVFLALDGPRVGTDTWTYFPDARLLFGRAHEPANWSPAMVPDGQTSLALEIFCSVGDDTWRQPDRALIDRAVRDLVGLGLVGRERVRDAWLTRAPYAYPIYRRGYEEVVRRVREHLSRWPTLHLTGRTGSFQYLNADAVIERALALADTLIDAGASNWRP